MSNVINVLCPGPIQIHQPQGSSSNQALHSRHCGILSWLTQLICPGLCAAPLGLVAINLNTDSRWESLPLRATHYIQTILLLWYELVYAFLYESTLHCDKQKSVPQSLLGSGRSLKPYGSGPSSSEKMWGASAEPGPVGMQRVRLRS